MDSKADDQLNLAHVARKKMKKKKLKQTTPVVQYRFKIREGSLDGIRVTGRICETDQF